MNWMTELDLLMTCKELSKTEKERFPWWKKHENAYNCEQKSGSTLKKRKEKNPKKQKMNWFEAGKNRKDRTNQSNETKQTIGQDDTIGTKKQKDDGCQVKERLWGNAEGCE